MRKFQPSNFTAFWLCFLLLPGSIIAQAETARDQAFLDVDIRTSIVERIADLLEKNYVYPDIGKKMGDFIKKELNDGEYDRFTKAYIFAGRLMSDLRSISHDKHLRVRFNPDTAAALNQSPDDETRRQMEKRRLENLRRNNFGFAKLERLPGNIGYLDLHMFAPPHYARETANKAMDSLADSDAVIIDLRKNGGGSPEMVQLICSYFFDSQPVHLNSLYWRPADRTDEFWTLSDLPGRRMPQTELYILTSSRTFSGAEEFSYNMKNLQRATLLGEVTGGGAHPVNLMAADAGMVVSVPVGRAINPITKTNWEGTGVQPDIAIPADQALLAAQILAVKNILEKCTDKNKEKELKFLLEALEKK